jgi:signal peptidase I
MSDDDQSVWEPAAARTSAEPDPHQKPSGTVRDEVLSGRGEVRTGGAADADGHTGRAGLADHAGHAGTPEPVRAVGSGGAAVVAGADGTSETPGLSGTAGSVGGSGGVGGADAQGVPGVSGASTFPRDGSGQREAAQTGDVREVYDVTDTHDIDDVDEAESLHDSLEEDDPEESDDNRQGSFWRELPVLIAVALGLALLIKAFLVQAFFIPSASMENTLQIGDRVLVNKVVYHVRPVKRGDIVVFNGLDSWDPEVNYAEPTNPVQQFFQWIGRAFGFVPGEKDYIKRVIGVPGDKVRCCDAQGRVTVNGQALEESSYLFPGDEPSAQPFKFTIPEGRLWVMGDHRSLSYDSRQHLGDEGRGSIPESKVIGRAFVVVWPASRWKSLDIPQTFKQPGLSAAALPATPFALGLVGAIPIAWLNRRRRLRKAASGPSPRAASRSGPAKSSGQATRSGATKRSAVPTRSGGASPSAAVSSPGTASPSAAPTRPGPARPSEDTTGIGAASRSDPAAAPTRAISGWRRDLLRPFRRDWHGHPQKRFRQARGPEVTRRSRLGHSPRSRRRRSRRRPGAG